MSTALVPRNKLDAIEKLLAEGDLAPMTQPQRLDYMKSMCKLLGISMLGQPFDFIKLNGKLQMYANAKCAAQLRAIHKISIRIVSCERIEGLFICNVEAETGKGRKDADIGVVSLKGLAGLEAANASMKCISKGKRRVTLSLCGLGSLDADTAKELAAVEAAQMTERKVEETHEKLAETQERPEFENREESPSVTTPPATHIEPENDSNNYVLKAGRNKGKPLKSMTIAKLEAWVEWYEKLVEAGKSLHPDIQDDAFNIYPHLEEMAEQQTLRGV